MQQILILIFILLIVVFLFKEFLPRLFLNTTKDFEGVKDLYADFPKYFKLKKYFFSTSEKSFFDELIKQNDNRYFILSKVRLEDLVDMVPGVKWKDRSIKRNYIKSRHIDFVIVDKNNSSIKAVIELDGDSHNQEKQNRYDKIKNSVLSAVEARFYRIRVGEMYSEKISEIFKEI